MAVYKTNLIYFGDRKKELEAQKKQARIDKNYQDAYELAQMLVSKPICNKICEEVFPNWYRVRAKIIKRQFESIREVSPFFADNKLDLWKRKCSSCGGSCSEYMADYVTLFPSKLTMIPKNPQLMFSYESEESFDYHFDGDDPVKVDNEWQYPKVRR